MQNKREIRWGVLGSAWINTMAIPGLLKASNGSLEAVSSRRAEVAEADRQKWGAKRAYFSYDDLLGDENIDAVYIPLPNHLHKEWTIRALQAGKHVLCEKPLALSLHEIESIADEAKRADRHVMEAFMYRFAPRWQRVMELIRNGEVGEVKLARITMGFKQFYEGYNIRFDPEVGGGVLWDMGCYAVNMSRLIFGAEPINAFSTQWTRPGERVDTTTSGILDFGGGRHSIFSVSFDFVNPLSQVEIIGTSGWVSLQGTGMRGEPFTRLTRHKFGDEVFLENIEPSTEIFPTFDLFAGEFEEMGRVILGEKKARYDLSDARNNMRALEMIVGGNRQSA